MSLKSRLEKIEQTRLSEPQAHVVLYDAEGQRPALPAGAKVVIMIPKNGREVEANPSPTDEKKP